MEHFSIPGAGAIIHKTFNQETHILMQTRMKPGAPRENGLLEIPAGKIRAFECIFDTLRREVLEETGLTITEIVGERRSIVYQNSPYHVVNFQPFSCAQNISGAYPIMVFVFLCQAEGELLHHSDESKNLNWMPVSKLEQLLLHAPLQFYPMHVHTLQKFVDYCKQEA